MTAAPAYLAPAWRFAGDDWMGANALTFTAWATPPVYAADGVTIATAGVPQDLTGYTVIGALLYQPRCPNAPSPAGASLPTPTGAIVNATQGLISLSLLATQTAFPRQSFAQWGNAGAALLIAQPKIVDANGKAVTVGLQQLFVF